MLVGYARVSTPEQKLDLQRDALQHAGCDRIFTDVTGGAQAERPGLADALAFLRAGDSLVIWKLDRLGRSLKDLIEQVTALQARQIGLRSLQESIDTTTSGGKLIFHVFGALAEFERDLIRERTQAGLQAARALATMRNRYAEDELSKAIARGVRQYVILGAGLDSFAYRRRDLAGVIRVFEVDHPATQQWKRARLEALNVSLPDHLTFVPVNFEHHTLSEALQTSGYRPEEPAFFAWLGVTPYLTEEAVFETLRFVAATALGSEIVFEYAQPASVLDDENKRVAVVYEALATARGEPWRSRFESASLAARLQELGFTHVWDFGPEEANARYFRGRTDGLEMQVPNLSHIMKARVGSDT